MSDKLTIRTSAFTKLFETHMKNASEESIRELLHMVVDATGSRVGDLIEYLDDPKGFVHPEYKCSIGSTVLIDKDVMYSNERKHYEENNLLVDEKWFTATIVSFNFIKGDYFEVEYLDENDKLRKNEVYHGYLNKENLL